MPANKDIIDPYIENGLIQRCVDYQFAKVKDKTIRQFKDDFINDLIVYLYDYDREKVEDAHNNNHMNALITTIIVNNIWSNTSPFYAKYRKFMDKSDDITQTIIDTYGE